MITQEDIKQFESIFSGAQKRYGLLDYYNKETGEKDCIEKKHPITIGQIFLLGRNSYMRIQI